MENCAEIRGLCVSFNGEEVLHGITTDIPRHGITVLLGRSGSGKTTLLRALNRLNESFAGYVGTGTVTRIRRSVGMVFQSPNPLPLSLRKNMILPLELTLGLKRDEAEGRMEKSLRDVGLWDEVKDRLNQHAASFSGGQQQRMCLARTLALEPDILLLDEPTASLDKKSAELIEEHLKRLEARIPLIMVSHSLAQARKLGAHFKILSEGHIINEFEREALPRGEAAEVFLEELL